MYAEVYPEKPRETAGAERETGEGRVPGEAAGLPLSPPHLTDEKFKDTSCPDPALGAGDTSGGD